VSFDPGQDLFQTGFEFGFFACFDVRRIGGEVYFLVGNEERPRHQANPSVVSELVPAGQLDLGDGIVRRGPPSDAKWASCAAPFEIDLFFGNGGTVFVQHTEFHPIRFAREAHHELVFVEIDARTIEHNFQGRKLGRHLFGGPLRRLAGNVGRKRTRKAERTQHGHAERLEETRRHTVFECTTCGVCPFPRATVSRFRWRFGEAL
jgi:hypothetical protein